MSTSSRSDDSVSSRLLRVDQDSWNAYVKKKYFRKDESEWQLVVIGDAWLPPSSVNRAPIRMRERPELCRTVVATLNTYLLKQSQSKSTHVVVGDIAKFLIKLIEYCWLNGFYRIQDMPEAAWVELRKRLVTGGFVAALNIEERTVELLKTVRASDFLRSKHQSGHGTAEGVRSEFLELLGTNISSRELNWVRPLLIQAQQDDQLAQSGEINRYKLYAAQAMSVTMLLQCLRAFNQLSEVDGPLGLGYLPTPDADAFARKHGRQGGRTPNITPKLASTLLKSAFEWIYDYGPVVVRLIEEIAILLAYYASPEATKMFQDDPKKDSNLTTYLSAVRAKVLMSASSREELEQLLGLKITTYSLRNKRKGEISINAILNQLFTACFIVLATMNARRRDEVGHKVIGLHMQSLSVFDEQLGLAQCEFYIEKTIKDYEKFFINDVSRHSLELLKSIASVAWGWAEHVNGAPIPEGREEKLFCYPAFSSVRSSSTVWYEFNQNQNGMAREFLEGSLGEKFENLSIAPHMFRRLYGIIYHYRYEDATLIALAKKYRHLDVTSVLRYVTNGLELGADQHPLSLWSAGRKHDRRIDEIESIGAEMAVVGKEKFRAFVESVIEGVESFAGQFAKLVGRFHGHLATKIDYSELEKEEKADRLSKALLSRGHFPEPFRDVTCMAGRNRPRAACAKDGRLAHERAGAVVCSGCPYSLIISEHLEVMEEDAASLKARIETERDTHGSLIANRELDNLTRVIALNRMRLGLKGEGDG